MEGLRDPLPDSPDDFLAWAESQEEKHELIEGIVVMQAGASRDHERVAKRIFSSLFQQLDDGAFDVNKGDFGVRIREGQARGSVLLPDVLVDRQSDHGKERATTTPVVVIEVLSPSTDLAHHVQKLGRYAQLPSRVHYGVVSQDEPEAYLWHKTKDGWPSEPTVVRGLDMTIALREIGATLRMADIYARPRSKAVRDPA